MFELLKWYADCVSTGGDALIVYSGQLRYKQFAVSYESTLAEQRVKHSLRRSSITAGLDCVSWVSRGLGLCGEWRGCSPEIRETVFQSDHGSVEWECLIPNGVAVIERTQRPALRGIGYLERLRLTIPPWRLPIHRLRWGRFLSERNTLIWIDWEGDFRTRIVYSNGSRVHATSVSSDELILEGGSRLAMDRGLVLREGKLGDTVLHSIPGLVRVAPPHIFLMDECKWRSRATLESPGCPSDRGWCIHEEVTWP